eukprot:6381539-Amphidinium_carterae.1
MAAQMGFTQAVRAFVKRCQGLLERFQETWICQETLVIGFVFARLRVLAFASESVSALGVQQLTCMAHSLPEAIVHKLMHHIAWDSRAVLTIVLTVFTHTHGAHED